MGYSRCLERKTRESYPKRALETSAVTALAINGKQRLGLVNRSGRKGWSDESSVSRWRTGGERIPIRSPPVRTVGKNRQWFTLGAKTACSLAGEVAAGLHFSIGRTARAAMDDVSVVTEHTCKLLGNVCAAVSTACACCRRFHGLPVLLGGLHGCDGGWYSDDSWWVVAGAPSVSSTSKDEPSRQRCLQRRYRTVRPGITLSGEANVNKGRRLFSPRQAMRSAKYTVSSQKNKITAVRRRLLAVQWWISDTEFRCLCLHSTAKLDIDRVIHPRKQLFPAGNTGFRERMILFPTNKGHRYKIPLSLTHRCVGM